MEKLLLDLEMEIANGQENARKTKELYQLLSSCNAYNILLLKAKQEYEREKININQHCLNSECYKNQIVDLFSLFKKDEYLSGKIISETSRKDMLFLIDKNTLLRIYSFDIMNSTIGGLSHIGYNFLKIDNCIAKVYKQSVYCGDPVYYDSHCDDKDAFGLFCNGSLVSPGFVLDSQFKMYDNTDIHDLLKTQSLDEIYEKINEGKNLKTKKLILTK